MVFSYQPPKKIKEIKLFTRESSQQTKQEREKLFTRESSQLAKEEREIFLGFLLILQLSKHRK